MVPIFRDIEIVGDELEEFDALFPVSIEYEMPVGEVEVSESELIDF
tara:strand:- start:1074 stop:1211 length:138 start_codon:yes stop_codon:yes gene_type:complete